MDFGKKTDKTAKMVARITMTKRLTEKLLRASCSSCAPMFCAIIIPLTVATAPETTVKSETNFPASPTAAMEIVPS